MESQPALQIEAPTTTQEKPPQSVQSTVVFGQGTTIVQESEEGNLQKQDTQKDELPPYLPPYPPKHTYTFTPVYQQRVKDQMVLQKMKTQQKGQVETSLTRIHSAELIKTHRYHTENKKQERLFEEGEPLPTAVPSLIEEIREEKKGMLTAM